MSTDESPERTLRVKDPDADGEGDGDGDDSLVDEKGPAQADAEDPSMGGTSDGDTGA